MHSRFLMLTLASLAPAFLASTADAQAIYESAYIFNDQPEVVETRDRRFFHWVENDLGSLPGRQYLRMEHYGNGRPWGLLGVWGELTAQPGRSEPRPALFSSGRTTVTFTDLVFSSASSEPIDVSLTFVFGDTTFLFTHPMDGTSPELLFEVEVELEGDTRVGASRVTIVPPSASRRERTGILEDLPPDRHVLLEGFTVPVNTPVSLRLEVTNSLTIPAGGGNQTLEIQPLYGTPGAASGLPFRRPVFVLPDGVRVDSVQAGIRDNVVVICYADFDGDGELSIFDFLAFQNLFDAGDPIADLDGDGSLTIFDFLAFQSAFDAGCD